MTWERGVTERPIDARHEMKRGLWWSGASTVVMRILDVGGSRADILKFIGGGKWLPRDPVDRGAAVGEEARRLRNHRKRRPRSDRRDSVSR
jgi:hypothetical protein